MQAYRSLSTLASITDRLLRNRNIQASCSANCGFRDSIEGWLEPLKVYGRYLSTGPAAEPEDWQEKGIRGAKAFDVGHFPQEKARLPLILVHIRQ